MKQQVSAFKTALATFQSYSDLLAAAITALDHDDRSDDLMASLMARPDGTLPDDLMATLSQGRASAATTVPFVTSLLAKPNALQAILTVLTHAGSLDRKLESALDMQSPPGARIPPPYHFFDPALTTLQAAFPRNIGDPPDTPEVTAFQSFLETPENPWRR